MTPVDKPAVNEPPRPAAPALWTRARDIAL
jgi:hypothetical protein